MTDSQYILIWWFLIFVIGAAGTPLSQIIFKKFHDSGYGLSKTLGILIITYTAFFFSIIRILPLARVTLFGILIVYIVFNYYLFTKNKKTIILTLRKNFRLLILEEVLFMFGLILWSFVRAHQPDLNGLEKFMDYGFVNTNLRTSYLPAPDMWFAGKGINYYWFGHFVTAMITKLSGIPSPVTYNLMLATILGLSLSSSFSLVSTLIANVFKEKSKRLIIIGGLVSAILLNFAGNFHTPYFIYKNGRDAYWYPDATRFIGYNPDVPDKTIHEFPMYSYVVADLHAHILNLPFVLLFLSLVFASLKKGKGIKFWILPLIGLTLGVMFMGNAWDFANYLLAAGFVYLIYHLRNIGFKFKAFYNTAVPIIVIIVTAILISLPFVLNFESIAQGVKLTHTKSPLWQLAILWGFPAVMTLIFLLRTFKSKVREDLFIFGLLAASFVLIALPEFVYVKDIYADTHYRANTMFKLTYQAFVMSYLSSGYITIRVIQSFKKTYIKILFVLLFSLIFASIVQYAFISTKSYYGELKDYRGLDGEIWLKEKNPDLYNSIIWLRENNKSTQPIILEAPGDSYTEYNSVSSYTGFPTVSGWFVHEWLWRGAPEFPQARVTDITEIYNSNDVAATKKLLSKYGVKFVVVGFYEREKFPDLDEQKFLLLGKEVYDSPTTKIYEVN